MKAYHFKTSAKLVKVSSKFIFELFSSKKGCLFVYFMLLYLFIFIFLAWMNIEFKNETWKIIHETMAQAYFSLWILKNTAIFVKRRGLRVAFSFFSFFGLYPSGYEIKMNFRPMAIFSEFRFAFFSQVLLYNVNQLANKRKSDPRETTHTKVGKLFRNCCLINKRW